MPTRITFLCVILVCHKFRLFLVDFPKSNSCLRKAILVATRILVFSLICEKSNSRIYENVIFEGRNKQFSGGIFWSENHTGIILTLVRFPDPLGKWVGRMNPLRAGNFTSEASSTENVACTPPHIIHNWILRHVNKAWTLSKLGQVTLGSS